jgi:F420-dependent oxidoreductase-like protein
MRIGVIAPQGWQGEYDGWDPSRAWARTVAVARQAERLGFESIWLFDHFHTTPEPTDEITFESFTSLSALAALTSRIRLGHIVICTAFRNPALTAKMISTMDAISGGRMELGIGAGWKRDEWLAYGYGFPPTRERLERLDDDLEVITRMLEGDRHSRATYEGDHSQVHDAINVPKPIQRPRVPIMVGGNGPNVTWRLAARFADELNLDGMQPDEVASSLKIIRERCEELGRDPASLPVSIHIWAEDAAVGGSARVARLAAYRELGLSRAMVLVRASTTDDAALESLADDARAAGLELAPAG